VPQVEAKLKVMAEVARFSVARRHEQEMIAARPDSADRGRSPGRKGVESAARRTMKAADLEQRFARDQAYEDVFEQQSNVLFAVVNRVRGEILHRQVPSSVPSVTMAEAQAAFERKQSAQFAGLPEPLTQQLQKISSSRTRHSLSRGSVDGDQRPQPQRPLDRPVGAAELDSALGDCTSTAHQ